jgi:hypothetical protein
MLNIDAERLVLVARDEGTGMYRIRLALSLTYKTDISSVDQFSDRQMIFSIENYSAQQIKVKKVYSS